MTEKSDFFNENNGKSYLCGDSSRIICELKPHWSLARMEEAVDSWRAKVKSMIACEPWLKTAKQLQPDDSDHHIRLYEDGRFAIGGSNNCWYEVNLDGSFQVLKSAPISETEVYRHTALIEISDDIAIKIDIDMNEFTDKIFHFNLLIYFDRQSPKDPPYRAGVSMGYSFKTSSDEPVVSTNGFMGLSPDLADRNADALKLAAAIARDLENFLSQPHEWIHNQYKQPKPTDAVLGGIKP